MVSKYEIGQKVVIAPAKNERLSPRGSDIETYAGQSGTVTKYYWISSNKGEVFYVYTVQIAGGTKEVVLHEDELTADIG